MDSKFINDILIEVMSEIVDINNINTIFIDTIKNKIFKLKKKKKELILTDLNIEYPKNLKKAKDLFTKEMITENLNTIMSSIKNHKLGLKIEVKKLLKEDINIDDIVKSEICLKLNDFLDINSNLKNKFNNEINLIKKPKENGDYNITYENKNDKEEIQGLYILTIRKKNTKDDYIVKLGSYAETQGIHGRIGSFGGGNCDTGSLTNKWFQKFIKKAIDQDYTSKFIYYNKKTEKIKINNLDDDEIDIIPYVVRNLETELFEKYLYTNNNIPPIFGSNCSK